MGNSNGIHLTDVVDDAGASYEQLNNNLEPDLKGTVRRVPRPWTIDALRNLIISTVTGDPADPIDLTGIVRRIGNACVPVGHPFREYLPNAAGSITLFLPDFFATVDRNFAPAEYGGIPYWQTNSLYKSDAGYIWAPPPPCNDVDRFGESVSWLGTALGHRLITQAEPALAVSQPIHTYVNTAPHAVLLEVDITGSVEFDNGFLPDDTINDAALSHFFYDIEVSENAQPWTPAAADRRRTKGLYGGLHQLTAKRYTVLDPGETFNFQMRWSLDQREPGAQTRLDSTNLFATYIVRSAPFCPPQP